MRKFLLSLVAVSSLFAAGCSGGDTAKTPDASGPKVVAEVGTCDGCQGQFPKAELAMHDGKMTCKKCIEAHGH